MVTQAESLHHRTCSLCEAACGLVIRHRANEVLAVSGDPHAVLSRGFICAKGKSIADVQADPDRLRQPLRRTAHGGWEEITWDEALDEAAERLRAVQAKAGKDAVGLYTGNPVTHSHGALLVNDAFVAALGTNSRFSAVSCDGLPHMLAALKMFGHFLSNAVPDLDRTHYLLCLGANPVVSNGSFVSAPNMRRRLHELRARGGRFVLIDPRRTESAALADEHLFIRPGTDAAFLLAVLHVVFEDGLDRLGAAAGYVRGLDDLKAAVRPFPPAWAEGLCGIPAHSIHRIAYEFATAPSAVAYGRMGVATSHTGPLNAWLIVALNVVTGNLDREGGAMFTTPAVDVVALTAASGRHGSFGTRKSRVRGLPEFCGEYPAATMAEEILTPGPGQIRALVVHAGNPVLSVPQGGELEPALESLEYMVSIDLYLNETSRHAHLILPPTGPLGRSSFPLSMNAISVRNVARYASPLAPRDPDSRHDWQILSELTWRLKAPGAFGRWRARRRMRALYTKEDELLLNGLIRWGPYGAAKVPEPLAALVRMLAAPSQRLNTLVQASALGDARKRVRRNREVRLDLRKLREHPHGIDLGPLVPMLGQRIFHSNGCLELAPELFTSKLGRQMDELTRRARSGAFLLIGRRHPLSNNSWMHNIPRLIKGRYRCTLLMASVDAGRMGLHNDQLVRVRSEAGNVVLPVEVSDDMMNGVVSMPHGWGHGRPGSRLPVATTRPGVSINDVIGADSVDSLTGMSILNSVEVQLEPLSEHATVPDVMAPKLPRRGLDRFRHHGTRHD
ncbi:MAG: molybdopterin-dependent oxidoreductase [Algiphilus sp.]